MKRRRYSADFKAKVAVEAISGMRPIHEIAAEHGVHPNQISQWKRQTIESHPESFAKKRARGADNESALRDRLYRQVGQLQMELEWLKKKTGFPA